VKIFISYSREDRTFVESLRADLSQLGHDVWMDQRLVGGQEWWDEILRNIRECDLFVLGLSPRSVESEACLLELRYSSAVRRPFLPAMVLSTDPNYLPPEIAHAQFVDYTRSDREALLHLVASITQLPPPPPLPDPLPEPPAMSWGPLYEVRRLIALATELDRKHQLWLVDMLQQNSTNPRLQPDVTELLAEFRQRGDLMADVLARIDELLRVLKGDRQQPPLAPSSPRAWLVVLVGGFFLSLFAAAEFPQSGNGVGYYEGIMDLAAIATIYAFALRTNPRFWGWWYIFAAFALDGVWCLLSPLLYRSPSATMNWWISGIGPMGLLLIGLLAFRPPWQTERRSGNHLAVAIGAAVLAFIIAASTMPTGYTMTPLGYIDTLFSVLDIAAGVWLTLERRPEPLLRFGPAVAVVLAYLNETFVTHSTGTFTTWEVFPWELAAWILAAMAAFASTRWPAAKWPAPAERRVTISTTSVPPSAAPVP
jgi:hypothetical protein